LGLICGGGETKEDVLFGGAGFSSTLAASFNTETFLAFFLVAPVGSVVVLSF
jgi:hypothetical protein